MTINEAREAMQANALIYVEGREPPHKFSRFVRIAGVSSTALGRHVQEAYVVQDCNVYGPGWYVNVEYLRLAAASDLLVADQDDLV